MIKNLVIGDAVILETGNRYGNMNTNKNFFPEELKDNAAKRKEIFLSNRTMAASDYGFNPKKLFMADQSTKDGSYFKLNQEFVDTYEDGWSASIKEDILVITDKTPSVVIGHPVADCPVVMAFDTKQKIAAIGHCSAAMVDTELPKSIIASLRDLGANDEDIKAYISAGAGKNWTYDCYPGFAKNANVWDSYITEENGIYHIDIKGSIEKQLNDVAVNDIVISPVDTITDENYFSNSASRNGHPEKAGRNFAGTFFKQNVKTR